MGAANGTPQPFAWNMDEAGRIVSPLLIAKLSERQAAKLWSTSARWE
jgi:hypothetical protein